MVDNKPIVVPDHTAPSQPAGRLKEPRSHVVETIIRPRQGWISINWAEMVQARELLYFLAWRDIKIRYKQTVLGFAWAVLQPLFSMLVFTVIFGRFARIPSEGLPYAAFVFAGLVPWTFFANGVTQGGQCLVNQQQLLTKIYMPRLFVPTAAVIAFLVDLVISFGLYAVVLAFYRIVPSPAVVLLPIPIALTILATLGLTYTLAALTVLYRDFRYVIPFLVQVMMYLSPVIYPVSLLPTQYRWILALNPMSGIIQAFRCCILGTPADWTTIAISTAMSLVLFIFGLFYFRKIERRFADVA